MDEVEQLERIEVKADVCFGKPVIKGTRHSIDHIFDHIAAGGALESYLEAFPHLAREDVLAAFAYAAHVFRTHKMLDVRTR